MLHVSQPTTSDFRAVSHNQAWGHKDIPMFNLWVTPALPVRRIGSPCEAGGLRLLARRIAAHPNGPHRAVLCSYECVRGAKCSRDEEKAHVLETTPPPTEG